MNPVLKSLFDRDCEDHAVPKIAGSRSYADMRIRDSKRRDTVRRILRDENLTHCIDLYHAAWVLNHGEQPEDAELAYRLAEQSFKSGYRPAGWLFAAAFDRYCMYRGLPQRFGTQIVPDGLRYRLWDVNPKTTDEERKQYDVPSLDEMRQRAAVDSEKLNQPPMDSAPKWLVEAISRWNGTLET